MSDNAIEARGLAKRFGDVVALDGVDISVPTGTVLGLLGPNGAGKTTAVRILTTILKADAGTATILGVDVMRNPDAVRPLFGLAGQYAAVDENLTGRENLRLVGRLTHQARDVTRHRVDDLLERFEIAEAGNRPVRTYSGGMRRRLDLAAALVHQPPVLLLDEPTTGLDPRGRNQLWEQIGHLVAEGTTLLLTTQYLEEADRLADRIMVIDHGQVIAEGTARELKARLGRTVIAVGLPDAESLGRAKTLLSGIGPIDLTADGQGVELMVDDGGRAVVAVVRALDAADVPLETLVVREPTLDDVFLQLTGHRAEEPETEEGA